MLGSLDDMLDSFEHRHPIERQCKICLNFPTELYYNFQLCAESEDQGLRIAFSYHQNVRSWFFPFMMKL